MLEQRKVGKGGGGNILGDPGAVSWSRRK